MTDQHNYSDNTSAVAEDDPLEELARIVSGDYTSQPGANHWPRTTPTMPKSAMQPAAPKVDQPAAAPPPAAKAPVAEAPPPPPQTDDFDLESELMLELGAEEQHEEPAEELSEAPQQQEAASNQQQMTTGGQVQSEGDSLEDALMAELGAGPQPQSQAQSQPAPVEPVQRAQSVASQSAAEMQISAAAEELAEAALEQPQPEQQTGKKSLVEKLFPVRGFGGGQEKQQAAEQGAPAVAESRSDPLAGMDDDLAAAFESEMSSALGGQDENYEQPVDAQHGQPVHENGQHQTAQPAPRRSYGNAASGDLDMDFGAAFDEQVRQMESIQPAPAPQPAPEPARRAAPSSAPIEQPAPRQQAAKPDFSSIWQQAEAAQPAPPPPPAEVEDEFASAFAEELELSDSSQPQQQPYEDEGWQDGNEFAGQENQTAPAGHYASPDDYAPYEQSAPDAHHGQYDDEAYHARAYHEDDYEAEAHDEQRTRRSPAAGFKFAAIALGVALVIGGVAIGYSFLSDDTGAQAPAVIAADPGPVKVKPDNPGGTQVANQDRASYERVSGGNGNQGSQERLVSNSEEPVDVSALSRSAGANSKAEARLQPGQGEVSGDEEGAQLAPRRVRTVAVKPDGTVVASPSASEQAAIELRVSNAGGFASDKAASQVPAAPALPSIGDAKTTGELAIPTPRPAPGRTSSNTTATTDPVVTAVADSQLPEPNTASSTTATPVAATSSNTQAAPARSEFMVQLSSQRSAEDAQKTYQEMQQKHASLLEGRQLSVERAEVEGRGVFFRVRVLADSAADADQLCRALQLEGGSCFVTR